MIGLKREDAPKDGTLIAVYKWDIQQWRVTHWKNCQWRETVEDCLTGDEWYFWVPVIKESIAQ